ncbi:lactonase family protein [Propioniciclava coleopterorum]|uniref:Lactonase family protein n=1 Tax=Propioniciclava coleopterorum TaxID=2714937 RepID=A0A6G7Y6G6_9ACTN|nr:beta-propeller fold lactonase family protein [Propioniciclava coleopterorum]QIK72309.1 lactonase family protein [Propioniciclava coleopterorum]
MTREPLTLVGNAKGGTISVLRLHEGELVPLLTNSVGAGCSTFAVDAARGLVYSATTAPTPAIITLTLDAATGELAEIARTDIPDALAYLTLSREGTLLLGASYHGGWGAVWPITEGTVGEATARVEYANLHCVITDPAGLHAYFVSLGAGLIAQYELDADGRLAPLSPSTVAAPEGSGPRHLILGGAGTDAYLVTEYSGEVIRYARDRSSGVLTAQEVLEVFDPTIGLKHSRFGADPRAEHLIWGADLHLARDERYLLASERSGSTVATVELDEGGVLGRVVALWSTEQQPRGFGVAPDGVAVVVAGEASGAVALGTVDPDGSVTPRQRVETGAGPNWVRFA